MTIKIEGNLVKIKVGDQMKTIGELHGRVLRVRRVRKDHLMKSFNSYGFAKQLIEEDFFDHLHIIEYSDEGTKNFLLERSDVLTNGRYYQAPEYEKQIFLDLPTLENYKLE